MSGDNVAVDLSAVGKRYVKYEDTPMLVSRALGLWSRTRRSELWALRNVDFAIDRGECVGVIGRNGSGKSTLLQLLAGVTSPTEGRVAVRGRVAPLISVGVGFHPELSGRENVYVNGMILGLSRAEINARFDEIVEFAEIGAFVDTPVKFYSSGMFVRLGFSVAVLADPDILLIDEVLAVGDMAFQLKCFKRIEEIRQAGATIALVSHNLNAIRRLCPRTIVIHDGKVSFDGDTIEAIAMYHELLGAPTDADGQAVPSEHSSWIAAHLERFELVDGQGERTRHIESAAEVAVEVAMRFRRTFDTPAVLALTVLNEASTHVYGETWALPMEPGGFADGDVLRMRVDLRPHLATGSYSIRATVATFDGAGLTPPAEPILFFATTRPTVRGITDMRAQLSAEIDR